jgi:hypothetical protein
VGEPTRRLFSVEPESELHTQYSVIGAAISHKLIITSSLIIVYYYHGMVSFQGSPTHTKKTRPIKKQKLRLINIQLIHTSTTRLLAANHIIRHDIHLFNKSQTFTG